MIRLEKVSKSFAATSALIDIDLQLESASTTVVIGPSGCGKSTLLRLINGLLSPDQGTINFAGEALDWPDCRRARSRMGYVIQDGGLFPHMRVERNVTLMSRLRGWDHATITERLQFLCELTRLPASLLHRYPAQLSGGQRQRVALMRALMTDPEVLLLDEPLGALDPMIRHELRHELKSIFSRLQKTVVLVTHDLTEARHFSDRVVLMNEGRVIQQGSLEELLQRPRDAFVKAFVGAQRFFPDPSDARP